MINLKPQVVTALKGDGELVALLGGPRVYFQFPADEAEFPRITYYEADNSPALLGDSRELASEVVMVVDVWAKGSTTAIAAAVNQVMTGMGFRREFAADLYEADTGVHHKTMRFGIKR